VTDHEPHSVDTCPLTKFEGELKLLHEADDDSHMAGINSDHSTREMNDLTDKTKLH